MRYINPRLTLTLTSGAVRYYANSFPLQQMTASRRGMCPSSDCDVIVCYDVDITK